MLKKLSISVNPRNYHGFIHVKIFTADNKRQLIFEQWVQILFKTTAIKGIKIWKWRIFNQYVTKSLIINLSCHVEEGIYSLQLFNSENEYELGTMISEYLIQTT